MIIDLIYLDAWAGGSFDRLLRKDGVDTSYYNDRITGEVVPAVNRLVDAVRDQGGPVLWVKVSISLPNSRDWIPARRNKSKDLGLCRPGTENYETIPGLIVKPADYIVPKKCTSAFWGGNAGAILRHRGVKNVLVAGCITNGGVLVNAVDAANNNFDVTIVDDGCAALSQELHQAALTLLPNLYAVGTAEQIVADFT